MVGAGACRWNCFVLTVASGLLVDEGMGVKGLVCRDCIICLVTATGGCTRGMTRVAIFVVAVRTFELRIPLCLWT